MARVSSSMTAAVPSVRRAVESEADDAQTMMMTSADVHDTQKMRPILAPPKRNGVPNVDVPNTGVSAWRGVEKPRDDLEIVSLVEKYL